MHRRHLSRMLAVSGAAIVVFVVYSWHSLANTGHDLRGRWLPLYFQIDVCPLEGARSFAVLG